MFCHCISQAQMDVVTWSVSELLSRHGKSIALQLTVMLVDQFCGFVLVSLMVTSCWPLSPLPGRALHLQGVWLSDTAQNSRRGGERWTGRGEWFLEIGLSFSLHWPIQFPALLPVCLWTTDIEWLFTLPQQLALPHLIQTHAVLAPFQRER